MQLLVLHPLTIAIAGAATARAILTKTETIVEGVTVDTMGPLLLGDSGMVRA